RIRNVTWKRTRAHKQPGITPNLLFCFKIYIFANNKNYMVALSTESVKSEDYEALSTWLLSKPNLTSGNLVEKAEKKLAEALGSSEPAVFTNSVNSADLLALTTLICSVKLQKGDKITDPATCNIQSISSIHHLGFTPILVDVNQ